MESIIFDSDSYKISHYSQIRPGTTSMFYYTEARGGIFPESLWFGPQVRLKQMIENPVTMEHVLEANEDYNLHIGMFNLEGWKRIVNKFGGLPPVRIRSLPEGTIAPMHTPLLTVESLDPETKWIAGWMETYLLRSFAETNIATISYNARKIIAKYLAETSDVPASEILFKLHDFGSRGVSSQESAGIGGCAHLVNFRGTDTTIALRYAKKYYNCRMAGFSIPAAEHSTITSWGESNETKAYENMLDQFAHPGKALAVVSDSYDIYNACQNIWGGSLRQRVIDSGANVIIRPDSGHPATVVCKCLDILAAKFGFTVNSKNYKVLNYVRIIQGDGINLDSLKEILEAVKKAGFSAENLAFGMGGALLQQHNRDTQMFATKCSDIVVDGVHIDVYKKPATDSNKNSMRGRLDAIWTKDGLRPIRLNDNEIENKDTAMQTIYDLKGLLIDDSLDKIRERAWPTND